MPRLLMSGKPVNYLQDVVNYYFTMNELFLDIIKRIKEIKNLHTDIEVAKVLKMTKNNLYSFKNRPSLPLKQIHAFCSQEGFRIEYIVEGKLPAYETDRIPMSRANGSSIHESADNDEPANLIHEVLAPYFKPIKTSFSDNSPDVQDAIRYAVKAFEILISGTGYANALRENITWFREAVEDKKKAKQLKDDFDLMKKKLLESGIL